MPTTDWLARHALYHPDAVALVWEPTGRAYTYADCHHLGQRLAAALREAYDLKPGDRLAVLAENSMEHVLLFFAAQKTGFILVPVNYRLAVPEVRYIVGDCDPALLFFGPGFEDAAAGLEIEAPRLPLDHIDRLLDATPEAAESGAAPAFDDPVLILYTSGTTGRPKGALITHGMLFWNAVNTTTRLDLTSRDATFNAAPFYHTGGWNVLLTPFLHLGATTYLLDRFDPEALLRLCDEKRLTILWGVPTMLKMMSDHPAFAEATLATVRYAIVGGEAMPEPLIRTWQAKGVPVRQGFGMTEVGPNCFSLPERDAIRKIGSIGFPNFYLDVRIVDAEGRDVPDGEPGELLMRGPVVTPGYWRNEPATRLAIEDGWFRTGDLVRRDADGYAYVVGRKKEMYISGGENVYPAEVEAVLYAHDAVSEAAVVGVPDERWGEAGMAFVVCRPGTTAEAEALLAHCRTHLAKYKVPRTIRFVDALPKGHSGKILKRALRDLAAPEATDTPAAPPR